MGIYEAEKGSCCSSVHKAVRGVGKASFHERGLDLLSGSSFQTGVRRGLRRLKVLSSLLAEVETELSFGVFANHLLLE